MTYLCEFNTIYNNAKVISNNHEIVITFRPNVADEQKIGFFSLDRATQTEDSEILDLKQMTDIIRTLTEVQRQLLNS